MRRHIWLAFILFGCGQTRGTTGTCTMAVGSTKAVASDGLPGGFLEIQSIEKYGASEKKTSYCAASVTFEGDVIRLWTAQHCYRVGLMDSLTLHASVKGEYVPIPLKTQDLEAAKLIRQEFSSTDPDVISDVVGVLDGAKRLTKDASSTTKRCLETSASHRSACFTAMDLVTFHAFQPEGTKSSTKDAISHLRQKFRSLASADTKLVAVA